MLGRGALDRGAGSPGPLPPTAQPLMHRRQFCASALALLAAPLVACGTDEETFTAPEAVPIESATFASALGVNLSASTKTPAGLYYRDLTVGTGPTIAAGQRVSVRYTGWLTNGQQFDSNVSSSELLEFQLGAGRLIPGFEQGVQGMRVGGRRQIIVPPSLGYGPGGAGPIPGNAILVFNVEVVSVR